MVMRHGVQATIHSFIFQLNFRACQTILAWFWKSAENQVEIVIENLICEPLKE